MQGKKAYISPLPQFTGVAKLRLYLRLDRERYKKAASEELWMKVERKAKKAVDIAIETSIENSGKNRCSPRTKIDLAPGERIGK